MRWKVRDANFSFCYFFRGPCQSSRTNGAPQHQQIHGFSKCIDVRVMLVLSYLRCLFYQTSCWPSRCKELLGTCFAFTTLVPFVRCRCSLSSNQPPPLIKSASVFGNWSILTSDVFSTLWTPEKALHSVFSLTTTLLLVHSAPFSQTLLSTRSSFTKLPFSQNN